MKTCQIYGHNGFDLCVTFNLVKFYQKLGFKTFFSEKIYEVDLLIVIRPTNRPFDLSKYHIPAIHIYDYVGNDFDNFADNLNKKIVYIFTTTDTKRQRIISNMNILPENVFVALPPVDIDMWVYKSNSIKKSEKLVHIGNYKPVTDEDLYRTNFFEYIKNNVVDVWGLNWNNDFVGGKYKGKSSLFNVSKVYANTKVALGFMYPFQRDVTFSSRFWQTTLNGCYLLSEPSVFSQIIPGIIQTNFEIEDVKNAINNIPNDKDLKKIAIDFWTSENTKINVIVQGIVKQTNNINSISIFKYLKLLIINTLRYWYQKINIFNLILK